MLINDTSLINDTLISQFSLTLIKLALFDEIVYERGHIKKPYETLLKLNSLLFLPTQL